MAAISEEVERFNIKFLKEVEKRPILYDKSCYNNSFVETERAWADIANTFGLTKLSCKIRFRNLRTVFRRHAKTKKRNSYYLTEALQFLIPHTKVVTNEDILSKYKQTEARPSVDEDGIKIEYIDMCEQNEDINEVIVDNLQVPEDTDDNDKEEAPEKAPSPADSFERKTFERLKKKKSKDVGEMKKYDRNLTIKMFLLSLLPELNEMSDLQLKVFKRKIFTLMDDITDEFD